MNTQNLRPIIEKHFPYDTFNPGQYRAIEESVKSILKGTPHTILSCPTGVGKSVIAITVHNVVNELKSRFGPTETVVLATTKGLQDQYNKDFPKLLDLKGKSNYFCHYNIKEGYNSPKCVEKIKSNMCSKEKCQYVLTRDTWKAHEGSKTTNSAMMVASRNLIPTESPIDLIIVDECHEIDKVIISQSSIKFNINDYPEAGKYYTDFLNTYAKWIRTFKEVYPTEGAFNMMLRMQDNVREDLQLFYSNMHKVSSNVEKTMTQNPGDYKWVIISNELNDLLDKLDYFASDIWAGLEWIMDIEYSDTGEETLVFKPIKSSGALSRIRLFNKAECFLHMSATIGGFDTYCENLGIDKSKATIIEIDNPIEVERRKVLLANLTQMNRNTPVKDIINAIEPIIRSETGNGIIHTVSFKLANDIYYNMPYDIKKRMVVSNNRKEIMELLARESDAIVLSPSVETGYDFKDDLARWQIIAKVPFLNLGDNYTKTRLNKSNKWYTREAILRIVQSCGRIVRGLNDRGTTYIIDENILRLITENTDMFPEWWLHALDMIE